MPQRCVSEKIETKGVFELEFNDFRVPTVRKRERVRKSGIEKSIN